MDPLHSFLSSISPARAKSPTPRAKSPPPLRAKSPTPVNSHSSSTPGAPSKSRFRRHPLPSASSSNLLVPTPNLAGVSASASTSNLRSPSPSRLGKMLAQPLFHLPRSRSPKPSEGGLTVPGASLDSGSSTSLVAPSVPARSPLRGTPRSVASFSSLLDSYAQPTKASHSGSTLGLEPTNEETEPVPPSPSVYSTLPEEEHRVRRSASMRLGHLRMPSTRVRSASVSSPMKYEDGADVTPGRRSVDVPQMSRRGTASSTLPPIRDSAIGIPPTPPPKLHVRMQSEFTMPEFTSIDGRGVSVVAGGSSPAESESSGFETAASHTNNTSLDTSLPPRSSRPGTSLSLNRPSTSTSSRMVIQLPLPSTSRSPGQESASTRTSTSQLSLLVESPERIYPNKRPESIPEQKTSKRTHALHELLSSERAYASDLALIRDIFLPLAQGKQTHFSLPPNVGSLMFPMHKDPPMSAQDVKIVFGNIEEIAAFADELSERLEVALGSVVPSGTGDDRVGELFCELAPRMTPMYLAYITRHPAAVARYTQLSTNPTPAMAQYLATTKAMTTSITHAWDIPSLLIKPLQRLLKYPLILQTILEHTPISLGHPDRATLALAKDKTEQVARQVNEGKRRWEVVKGVLESGKSPPGGKRNMFKPRGSTNGSETGQDLLALEKRVKECAEVASKMAECVATWATALTSSTRTLFLWSRSFQRVVDLDVLLGGDPQGGSDAVRAFSAVAQGLDDLSRELAAVVREELVPQLHRLGKTSKEPLLLCAHAHTLAGAHYNLVNTPYSKSRPSGLLEASQSYLALSGQLRDELPRYIDMFERALGIIVLRLSNWQSRYFTESERRWRDFWIALDVEGDTENSAVETNTAETPDLDQMYSALYGAYNVRANHELHHEDGREAAQAENPVPDQAQQPTNPSPSTVKRGIYSLQLHGSRISLISCYHFPLEDLIQAFIKEHSAEQPLDSVVVKYAVYGKKRRTPHHEFVVLELGHTRDPTLSNYVVLDRTRVTGASVLSSVQQSNSAIARDEFRFSCDGNREKLLRRCGLIPYDTVETIEFPTGDLLPFYELATIALVTSHHRDYYHILDANCYWFAGLIWEQVLEMYPEAKHEILQEGVRGKFAGLLNYFTPGELERDEVGVKIQAMLSEMKTIIAGVQKVYETPDSVGWDYVSITPTLSKPHVGIQSQFTLPKFTSIDGRSVSAVAEGPGPANSENSAFEALLQPRSTGLSLDRTNALLELLVSERAYASDLASIRNIFLPLAQGKSTNYPLPPGVDSIITMHKDPPMNTQDVKIVFGNVEKISAFANELSDRLGVALASVLPSGTGDDRVGELFCELAPRMTPMYLEYTTQHPAAVARYTQLSTNPTPAMAQYLATISSIPNAQDIPSLLSKPLQRLPRYPLMLQTILENTPPFLNHPDRATLVIAKEKVEEVIRQVNKGKPGWKAFKSPLGGTRRTLELRGPTNGSETDQDLITLEKRVEEQAGSTPDVVIAGKSNLNSQTGLPTSMNPAWSASSATLETLTDRTFPGVLSPLKSTMKTFLGWVDSMEDEDINSSDTEYGLLALELRKMAEVLAPQLDNPYFISTSIENTFKSITGNFEEIEAERKLIRYCNRREAQIHHKKIHGWLSTITGELEGLRFQVQAEILTLATKAEEDTFINSLRPSQSALYGSNPQGITRQHCAKDTRRPILETLDSWSNDSSFDLIWVNGMAGTGKTTIAYSFMKALHDRQKPAVSFFCSGVDPECRDVSRIIPTITHQLANISPEFRRQLGNLLRKDASLAALNDIPSQFTNLLKAPFKGVGQRSKDIIVLIDGLDECDDPGEVGTFLDQLEKYIEELPLNFLVTSRPEAWIRHRMQPMYDRGLEMVIVLHEVDRSEVQADIKLYLKQELACICPLLEELELLARQCGTLFIYAATLVRYINPMGKSVPFHKRLTNALRLGVSSGPLTPNIPNLYREMDRLYAQAVNNALNDLDEDEKWMVLIVLRTVLCAKEPISIYAIAVLSGLGNDVTDLFFTLERLRAVIYVSEANGMASVFHASFPDFMFDQDRSKELFCDPAEHNHIIAKQCFGLMKELRFNICDLSSSYMPDQNVITQSRIECIIEPALSYACHHWAEHLARTTRSDLCEELQDFLSQRLLFWMEILTLKGTIALGEDQLLLVVSWLLSVGSDDDLITLAEDARNFVTSFAANPISISTPHIYTSLLALCPPSSAVFKCYRDRFQRLIEPDHRTAQLREVSALACWKHDSVLSVAYSPDGTKIVFGCMDGTVGVRALHGGASILSSSGNEAHQRPVWSVAFAPTDEIGIHTYLASGSDDGTIRTWNIHSSALTLRSVCRLGKCKIKSIAFLPNGNIASGSSDGIIYIWDSSRPDGTPLKEPLRIHAHTDTIWSVACSPDGKYVASGSADQTIRFWNPKTGQKVLQTLTNQTSDINSIAFSYDGKLLASGSSDRTICIWNIPQGTLALPPFQAHSEKVLEVRFSSNGKHLASSSLDRSIRIWDPRDGKFIGGPFEGHIGPIYSIAFSPDSTRIISGSPDGTIQLWDPKKSAFGDKSLGYHTNGIALVAFSPNDRYIGSCSYDSTLSVWDVSNKNSPVPIGSPFRGHTAEVTSLAFSPNGTRIVTGSVDGTARVWNIQNLTAAPIIFQEHKGRVLSVAFAPDGSFIVSAGVDTIIRMWCPTTRMPISDPLKGHTDEIESVAISPDGTSIASGSADKIVRVWDISPKNASPRVLEGHTGKVWSVAYSADGSKLASSSSDGTIRLWNLPDGSSIGDPIVHKKMITSVAFSPIGNYIAWGADDSTIRLWDWSKDEYVGKPFQGHCGTVWSVAFSPDGTHIASGSHDGTVRIWDIQKRTLLVDGDDADANADWILEPDGWMKRGKDLLLWVPYEVARSLLTPHCRSVISSCGSLRLDLEDTALGAQWQDCFIQPEE
ncbi:Vegetative incompatibility protein HET-E-1 [Podospora anserina] [Rhizoctonia solani]|uniref:Vegetative incompatibility protein HET-E-1 [Podospora anserina] n=1 Tax=Rhizoctonia solani TaxID=456999 RepID=A0A0K6FUX2_9AGAM|nr:Vegetative incompatibility protein HET-E-1 [Podospora anserina] [Rhizoctonia solani]